MQLQQISTKIYEIRGKKVILDFDLAKLYDVETRVLKQAIKRNLVRFPEDFMFVISEEELAWMVSQNVIPSKSYAGGAYPFAFTQEGIAMLSGILRSKIAIDTNIAIMRAFVLLRQFALSHKDLTQKLQELEARYNHQFHTAFEAIDYLMNKDQQQIDQEKRTRIGFKKQN